MLKRLENEINGKLSCKQHWKAMRKLESESLRFSSFSRLLKKLSSCFSIANSQSVELVNSQMESFETDKKGAKSRERSPQGWKKSKWIMTKTRRSLTIDCRKFSNNFPSVILGHGLIIKMCWYSVCFVESENGISIFSNQGEVKVWESGKKEGKKPEESRRTTRNWNSYFIYFITIHTNTRPNLNSA